MRSAPRLYRLLLALGTLGILAIAAALGAAATATSVGLPTLHDLAIACRATGLTELSPTAIVVLILAGLGLATAARGAITVIKEIGVARRTRSDLHDVDHVEHGGVEALVIDEVLPVAFCGGYLRPRVYISEGALVLLDENELAAVLAHEAHHAARRDPLRLLAARVLAEALFVLPVLGRLRDRYAALAELAADEAAVRATGDPAPLASALLSLGERARPGVVAIAAERVDQLCGARPATRPPLSLLAGAVAAISVLLVLAASVARAAPHGGIPLAGLVAQGCMIAMIAAPVAVAAAFLLTGGRLVRAALARRVS